MLPLFLLTILWIQFVSFAEGQGPAFSNSLNINGKASCPCIGTTDVLSKLEGCGGEDGGPPIGVLTNRFGRITCVPISHGFSCQAHDLSNDPECSDAYNNGTTVSMHVKPALDYCNARWCYVDKELCKDSAELFYRSDSFPGSNLFHSYSTCNSSTSSILPFQSIQILQNKVLQVTIPEFWPPVHYKHIEHANNTHSSPSLMYKDDTVPWM